MNVAKETIGKYTVERQLGQGAMGVVYLAYDSFLERHCAVKLMNTGGDIDDALRGRFFLEARSAAKFNHPNIVTIYDMGEDRNRLYIAMEYVEGQDLRDLIKERIFLSFEQKLELVIKICHGVDYAHQRKVVHRDIKPGNLRITQDGEVKILDFGLARLESSEMTRTGALMGTPYYMSPEQARGIRDIDGRSDLFSLGVVLYELISNKRPFEGDSPAAVCLKIVSEPHPPLSQVIPDCATELSEIVDRALAKDRQARFADCKELAEALTGFLRLLPGKQKKLNLKVQSLQSEFRKGREKLSERDMLDFFDPTLLDVPEADVPEKTFLANRGIELAEDYGLLLDLHERLQQRLREITEQFKATLPILSLLESARQSFASGELDSCLRVLHKIRRVCPGHQKVLEMEQECHHLLEKRQREQERKASLQKALEDSRSACQVSDFTKCFEAASRILTIDPLNKEGLEFKRVSTEGLDRQQKVEDLLVKATAYYRSREYEACQQLTSEALELDRENAKVKQLHVNAGEASTRARKVAVLSTDAQKHYQNGDYEKAVDLAERILKLESDFPKALEFHRMATLALQSQQRFEELLSEARALNSVGQAEACFRVTTEGLALNTDHVEMKDLHESARRSIERERQVRELLEKAQGLFEEKQYQNALATCDELLALESQQQEGLALRRAVSQALSQQQYFEGLLAKARGYDVAKDYEACYQASTKALELQPHHPELTQLRDKAHRAMERSRQIDVLLERAHRSCKTKSFMDALQAIQEVLSIEPNHSEAHQLQKQISEQIGHHRKVKELVAEARGHLRLGDYEACLNVTNAALELDPDNVQLKKLQDKASQSLEGQRKLSALLDKAHDERKNRNQETLLKTLQEILVLDAKHPEALEMQRQTLEDLKRKRQAEEMFPEAQGYYKSGDYMQCTQIVAEALELDPDHQGLSNLHKQLTQMEELLEKARHYHRQRDYGAELSIAEELLQLEPKHPEALEIKRSAPEALSRLKKFEALLVEARGYEKSRDYKALLTIVEQALRLESEHPELNRLNHWAQQALQKEQQALQKKQQVNLLLKKAHKYKKNKNFDQLLEIVQQLSSLKVEKDEVQELEEWVLEGRERGRKIEHLLASARGYQKSKDYLACAKASKAGLELEPSHLELQHLADWAHQALQQTQKEESLVDSARKLLEEEKAGDALRVIDELLSSSPRNSGGLELQALAEKKLLKLRNLEELLAAAQGYYNRKDFENLYKITEEALKLQPGHAEIKKLHQEATSVLKERREQEERKARVSQLWEVTCHEFRNHRHRVAHRNLITLLQLDPNHREALSFKKELETSLRSQQKKQVLLASSVVVVLLLAFLAYWRMPQSLTEIQKQSRERYFTVKQEVLGLGAEAVPTNLVAETERLEATAEEHWKGGSYAQARNKFDLAYEKLTDAKRTVELQEAEESRQRYYAEKQDAFRLGVDKSGVLVLEAEKLEQVAEENWKGDNYEPARRTFELAYRKIIEAGRAKGVIKDPPSETATKAQNRRRQRYFILKRGASALGVDEVATQLVKEAQALEQTAETSWTQRKYPQAVSHFDSAISKLTAAKQRAVNLQRASESRKRYYASKEQILMGGTDTLPTDLVTEANKSEQIAERNWTQRNYQGARTQFDKAYSRIVRADDSRKIRQVLEIYRTALQQKDRDKVMELCSNLPKDNKAEIEGYLRESLISISLEPGPLNFRARGESAMVRCKQVIEKQGQRSATNLAVLFEKKGVIWRITGFYPL